MTGDNQLCFESTVGPITVRATHRGVSAIRFLRTKQDQNITSPILEEAKTQIGAYLKGSLSRFSIPLDIQGTHFQRLIWKKLCKVPYGKTISYEGLAQLSKKNRAARAVGLAMSKNPVPILIPCHRVIRKNGELGGFSSPMRIKKSLLVLESTLME